MRYKTETTEAERRGDGLDDPDWDSLSARARRRQQTQRQRGTLQLRSKYKNKITLYFIKTNLEVIPFNYLKCDTKSSLFTQILF